MAKNDPFGSNEHLKEEKRSYEVNGSSHNGTDSSNMTHLKNNLFIKVTSIVEGKVVVTFWSLF